MGDDTGQKRLLPQSDCKTPGDGRNAHVRQFGFDVFSGRFEMKASKRFSMSEWLAKGTRFGGAALFVLMTVLAAGCAKNAPGAASSSPVAVAAAATETPLPSATSTPAASPTPTDTPPADSDADAFPHANP